MIRSLIYHIAPIPGSSYKWNIEHLLHRWHVFNGLKLIAIATGADFDDPEEVKKLFPNDSQLDFLIVENDPFIREAASFVPLLKEIRTRLRVMPQFQATEKQQLIFYGHTKGITRNSAAVKLWTEMCYHYNLDSIKEIEDKFEQGYKAVGAFKRYGAFPKMHPLSDWHYAGTFFWFLNEALPDDWKQAFIYNRYGVEQFLSLVFTKEEAYCIAGDDVKDPYNLKHLKTLLQIR